MAGIILRVTELLEFFNPSERKVAAYILDQQQKVVGMTVGELAEQSQTNKATIIRFCKKVGCSGYRDFSIQLAAELAVTQNHSQEEEYTDVRVGDDIGSIMKNVCANNVRAIEDSLLLLDSAVVQQAVDMLIAAHRVNVYGIGASGVAAQDMQQKFVRINKNCAAYEDSHMQLTSAANLNPGEVAVILSWSGETKEMIEVAKMAKKNQAGIITITRYGQNPLCEYADVKLFLSSPETSIRCGAMSSRIVQMTMIDILFSCLVSQDYHNVRRYLERTRQEVHKNWADTEKNK